MQARFYDPTTAAFTSRDSWNVPNRYNYANANPIAATDPTGHIAAVAALCGLQPEACLGAGIAIGVYAFRNQIAAGLQSFISWGVSSASNLGHTIASWFGFGSHHSAAQTAAAAPAANPATSVASIGANPYAWLNGPTIYTSSYAPPFAGLTFSPVGGTGTSSIPPYSTPTAPSWTGTYFPAYTPTYDWGPPPIPAYQPHLAPTSPMPVNSWTPINFNTPAYKATIVKNTLPNSILHPGPFLATKANPLTVLAAAREANSGAGDEATTGSIGAVGVPADPAGAPKRMGHFAGRHSRRWRRVAGAGPARWGVHTSTRC
jgi:hypothetical protein